MTQIASVAPRGPARPASYAFAKGAKAWGTPPCRTLIKHPQESGLVAAHLLPNEAVQSRDENDEERHLEKVELD